MADTAHAQEFFEQWKKQMEDGAQLWARVVNKDGPSAPGATDPLSLWRPFMDQATDTWVRTMRQGGRAAGAADAAAQGKAFLDQWIAAWDKLLADTMQTEAFAEALGKHLDQWLAVQGPMKKAADESTEATLKALGLPSRHQTVGIAKQLMDLDDRLEAIEDHMAALRARLDTLQQRPPRKSRGQAVRTPKAADKR